MGSGEEGSLIDNLSLLFHLRHYAECCITIDLIASDQKLSGFPYPKREMRENHQERPTANCSIYDVASFNRATSK
jgi:hypothetical protein